MYVINLIEFVASYLFYFLYLGPRIALSNLSIHEQKRKELMCMNNQINTKAFIFAIETVLF